MPAGSPATRSTARCGRFRLIPSYYPRRTGARRPAAAESRLLEPGVARVFSAPFRRSVLRCSLNQARRVELSDRIDSTRSRLSHRGIDSAAIAPPPRGAGLVFDNRRLRAEGVHSPSCSRRRPAPCRSEKPSDERARRLVTPAPATHYRVSSRVGPWPCHSTKAARKASLFAMRDLAATTTQPCRRHTISEIRGGPGASSFTASRSRVAIWSVTTHIRRGTELVNRTRAAFRDRSSPSDSISSER